MSVNEDVIAARVLAEITPEIQSEWMTKVDDAIWENTGLPVLLTTEEASILFDDIAVSAQVFFQDFDGIVAPQIKKGKTPEIPKGKLANELPNS